MKVTVTFGETSVVVPCKDGWTVQDLIDQATRRYRRILGQEEENSMKIRHLESAEGGILDVDDMLSDLVEDREKLVAVFQDDQRPGIQSPTYSNGFSSNGPSPEPTHYYPHLEYEDPNRGEIEVNEAILKANTPLSVRSSSDPALALPHDETPSPLPDADYIDSPEPEISHALKGALERVQTNTPPATMNKVHYSSLTRTVELPGDQGPLGIHVVPYCSSLSGRTLGLHIKGIEENSRSKRENIFREDESIVQINDIPLIDKTFAQSQEVFRQAMGSSAVRLEVLPAANKPRYEKRLIGQLFTSDGKDSPKAGRSPMLSRPEPKAELKRPEPVPQNAPPVQSRPEMENHERVSLTPSPRPASVSPEPRVQNQTQAAGKGPTMPGLPNVTSKKGGKKIQIDLKKGPEGLGFTVVTRDSSVHGPGPILVKNIMPQGAAVEDGRLQPGDRILEVNGVDMTGRTQEELVAMLRSTKQGESVHVLVARQEDIFLPRELKGEEPSGRALEDGREQLMYEIPLNETGSAGLGVSLKGNKSRETGEDLGIFIKSIIHGGAAYKDGRLSVNDQLIAVNGEPLLGRSNHSAMETLRRSMSSEGNARGTIQLVVLRAQRLAGGSGLAPIASANQPSFPTGSSSQEQRGRNAYQRPPGPSRTANLDSTANGVGHAPVRDYDSGSAPFSTTNGSQGYYSNDEEEQSFPSPPSPGTIEEINREFPHPVYREPPHMPTTLQQGNEKIRNRLSKSMDLVADESNVGSLVGPGNEPSGGVKLGPMLGLSKSSSLESLLTAVSEAKHEHAQVPFHRPRPNVVRGRGCNQSFRHAIDKSYEGPSEDDDDMSDQSSGHETPASTSSRQDLDADDGKKKKKTKGKKKEKKSKGKKKAEDSAEDPEKKNKKKGFALLRFGKKKEDKNKDAASKSSKNKLEALSEEELDGSPIKSSYDPRYAEIRAGRATPDRASLPDMEDDDSDPNYARISNFRRPPSPQQAAPTDPPALSSEELDGLYAKVNKSRPQMPTESDQRFQGPRRDHQLARAAPGYEELDTARRRVLDNDPQRMAPRGAESRPEPPYENKDRHYPAQPRRDPYDYPTHSRPAQREPVPGYPHEPPASTQAGRMPPPQSSAQSQPAPGYYQQKRQAVLRQDVPPSPTMAHRGRQLEAVRGRGDGYRQASPGRYTSPDRYRYGDENQPEARRKNPLIGAV